jgi:hypothetical protein
MWILTKAGKKFVMPLHPDAEAPSGSKPDRAERSKGSMTSALKLSNF